MDTTDITVQILREIRDRIDATNARLDAFESRVDARFAAMDARFDAVDARFDGVDSRLFAIEGRLGGVESGITSLHRDVARLRPIGEGDALVKRVTRCERDIAELKQRLDDPKR